MHIGVDIGGTHTRIARSPLLENIKFTDKVIIPTLKNFEEGALEVSKKIKTITEIPKGIGICGALALLRLNQKITRVTNSKLK